jgi:hypothetical protein
MKAAALLALASSASALQLGALRAPAAAMRAPALRMQLQNPPETSAAEAGAEPAAAPAAEGAVVPTSGPAKRAYLVGERTAEQEAYMESLLAKGDPILRTGFRRAEFWTNETANMLEVMNVLGRFDRCEQFRVRTEFSTPESTRVEDPKQGETLKRYEMAQRMGCCERVALWQNAPKLPFTNEKLAAHFGLTCADFEGLEVSKASCEIVYDVLAESASGLIPYDTFDARRAKLLGPDNDQYIDFNFRNGLYKSRSLFVVGVLFLGKANFLWILVGAQLLHDWKPDVVPTPVDMGLFKIWGIV